MKFSSKNLTFWFSPNIRDVSHKATTAYANDLLSVDLVEMPRSQF